MRKLIILTAVLALFATACAEPEAPVAASDPEAVEEADHDDEETDHDDEEADHDDEEADHDDEEADHDDEEADHDDEPPVAEGEATSEVQVVMSEFAFEPENLSLPAGETVTLVLVNEGVVEHEFRLSNQHRIDEHIAEGHADHDEDGEEGHHEENADIVVLVAAGETKTVDITVPEDAEAYSMVSCLIPGHYEAGMFTDLTLTDA